MRVTQVQRSTNNYACMEEGEPGDEAMCIYAHVYMHCSCMLCMCAFECVWLIITVVYTLLILVPLPLAVLYPSQNYSKSPHSISSFVSNYTCVITVPRREGGPAELVRAQQAHISG